MPKFKDISGNVYGRLTVIKRAENASYGAAQWVCKCSCGNVIIANGQHLREGATKSCGCLRQDVPKQLFKTHGLRKHPLYTIWAKMKQRCLDTNDERYSFYGGRDITVCDLWKNNFLEFYNWAVNNGYKKGLTIERIDNNKGYCPENCKWATMLEQANNKRNNHNIEINGEIKTLAQWCREYNIKPATVCARINNGWDEVAAIITPVRKKVK